MRVSVKMAWIVLVLVFMSVLCASELEYVGTMSGHDMSAGYWVRDAQVLDASDGVVEYAGTGVRVVGERVVTGNGIIFVGEIIAHTSDGLPVWRADSVWPGHFK